MANFGHGHVFPRDDGGVARCGGPAICAECALDAQRAREGFSHSSSPLPGEDRIRQIVREEFRAIMSEALASR